MTIAGNLITVDSQEVREKIDELLCEVEQTGRLVRILRGGRVVAELRRTRRGVNPLVQHGELKGVQFHESPTAPLDEADWPLEQR